MRRLGVLRGRSRLSAARVAASGEVRGDVCAKGARQSQRQPSARNYEMVAHAARSRARFTGRARHRRQSHARNRLGPLAAGARAGGSRYRRGTPRGGIYSWWRVGHWDRSLPRARLAGATVRRKPRWRRAGSQSRRLRCSLGNRCIRQISSRNRSGTVRCGSGHSRP